MNSENVEKSKDLHSTSQSPGPTPHAESFAKNKVSDQFDLAKSLVLLKKYEENENLRRVELTAISILNRNNLTSFEAYKVIKILIKCNFIELAQKHLPKLTQNSSWYLELNAAIYKSKGDIRQMTQSFEKLVLLNPDNDYYNISLMSALISDKKFDQAIVIGDKLLVNEFSSSDNNLRWLLELIMSLNNNKLIDAYVKKYGTEIKENHLGIYCRWLYDQGEISKCLEIINDILASEAWSYRPDFLALLNILFEDNLKKENWKDTESLAKSCIKWIPQFAIGHLRLLDCYQQKEDTASFIKYAELSYNLYHFENTHILRRYIYALELQGNIEKATKIINEALLSDKRYFLFSMKFLMKHGQLKDFPLELDNNILTTIEKLEGFYLLYQSYFNQGFYQKALQFVRLILAQNAVTFEEHLTYIDISYKTMDLKYLLDSKDFVFDCNYSKHDFSSLKSEVSAVFENYNILNLFNDFLQLYFKEENAIDYSLRFLIENYLRLISKYSLISSSLEDPSNAFKVAQEIKHRIQKRIPSSLIRLGDGEGNFLKYPDYISDFQEKDQTIIADVWWGKDRKNPTHHVSDSLINDINHSDLLGIIPLKRIFFSLRGYNHSGLNHNLRGIMSIMHNALTSSVLDNKIIVSSHIHSDLEKWDLYRYILKNVDELSVITCHKEIPIYIQERFGLESVKLIQIPPEIKYSNLFGINDNTNQLDASFHDIVQAIKQQSKNKIFLVGAGILGKSYCNVIKQHGGIAIDVGSVFDTWLGYKTRGNYTEFIRPMGFHLNTLYHSSLPEVQAPVKTNHYLDYNFTQQKEDRVKQSILFKIVGHPRTGTGYTSQLFGQFGYSVGHESLQKDGICSWVHSVDNWNTPKFGASKIGEYNISAYVIESKFLICLVRNPQDAIPSIMFENMNNLSYNYRRFHIWNELRIDLNHYANPLEKAIVSYVKWIEIIASKNPDGVFKLESLKQDAEAFFDKNNLPYDHSEINESNVRVNSTQDKFGAVKINLTNENYSSVASACLSMLSKFCLNYDYPVFWL